MAERFAISAGTIVPMNSPPVTDGAVIVSDCKIERIVPRKEIPPDVRVEEYPDSILLPALVNAHTHLVYSSYRGIADDAEFFSWLTENIVPLDLERHVPELCDSAGYGVRECLRNGITAIGENHYLMQGLGALSEAGMKGVFFYELFGVRTHNLSKSIENHRRVIESLAQDEPDTPNDIKCGIAPHAPYSVPMSMARMAREVSCKYALPLSIHVAETHAETDYFQRGEGPYATVRRMVKLPAPNGKRTPLMYLDECGLLGPTTLLIHGVHLSDSDLNIIADRKCTLVTCPTSNAKLGSGIARATAWYRRGIPICIATDSLASSDSFDMFEEMRRFVLFQRALTGEVDTFKAEDVLRMITTNPAKALGLDHQVGDLRNGSSADLLLVNPDRESLFTHRDVYQTILWGTTVADVQAVWLNGRKVHSR